MFKPAVTALGNPMDKQHQPQPVTLENAFAMLDMRMGRMESDVSDIKSEMKDLRGLLVQVLQALAKIDGRMDEQRQTINALIPTRLAAVGER